MRSCTQLSQFLRVFLSTHSVYLRVFRERLSISVSFSFHFGLECCLYLFLIIAFLFTFYIKFVYNLRCLKLSKFGDSGFKSQKMNLNSCLSKSSCIKTTLITILAQYLEK